MRCDICQRQPSDRLPFNCTLCAGRFVYQPRLDLSLSLLERENSEKDVERTVNSMNTSQKAAVGKASQEPSPAWVVQRATADRIVSEEKTHNVLNHLKGLREEIQHMKLDIAKRKAVLARRRKEMTLASERLSKVLTTAVEPVESDIRIIRQKWESLRQRTVEQRLLHCTQAARLYTLQQHKRRRGGGGKDIYSIGFTSIPDLKELNISYHLSLKLPAEITLPHTAHPLATILSPNVSYIVHHQPFSATTPPNHSSPISTVSRHVKPRSTPRPRPLYLKKRLPSLAKDDPLGYAYFVEGVTLLAWDVAWLCKTQGLDVGDGSWEEVCAIGKNLWQLLLASSARPPVSRQMSSDNGNPHEPPMSRIPSITSQPRAGREGKEAPPMGYFSHGTVYGFLAAARGNEYMREWRLQNPVKVIDKVKAMLLAERTGAEWEILEGNDWEGEAEVQPGTGKGDNHSTRIEDTGILVKEDGHRDTDAEDEKGRGTSGWMKVKTR
ncbi:MAG: hypothetical protein Q9163_001708 [Psora crenata]